MKKQEAGVISHLLGFPLSWRGCLDEGNWQVIYRLVSQGLQNPEGLTSKAGGETRGPDNSAWAAAALLALSKLFATSGPLRLTAPKNTAAFAFGPSSCCCWQILCQEVAKRIVTRHLPTVMTGQDPAMTKHLSSDDVGTPAGGPGW